MTIVVHPGESRYGATLPPCGKLVRIVKIRPMVGTFGRIAELEREGKSAVVVTIVAAEGPVPREAGARMVVFPEGRIEGTIGGGALEKRATEEAQELLSTGKRTLLRTYDLEELGMVCGGRATLFYELLMPPITLHIFGAGHVGEKLFSLAKLAAPFAIRIYDVRENIRGKIPEVTLLSSYAAVPDLKGRDYAFICTHSHEDDYRALKGILSGKETPAYVGLVGSKAKWAKMREQLLAEGVREERVSCVHCPVGLPLGGKDPGSIAVSALAEILAHHHGRLREAQKRLK